MDGKKILQTYAGLVAALFVAMNMAAGTHSYVLNAILSVMVATFLTWPCMIVIWLLDKYLWKEN